MKIIYGNMDLGVIDIRINENLPECVIWGDIELSFEEYEVLNEKIKNALLNTKGGYNGYLKLLKEYPAALITQVIYFILYNDENNFWNEWQESIGIHVDTNHTGIIGAAWIKQLIDLGFDKFEEGGYKYLTPLVCQAGVPNNSLDHLFYLLENIETQYFDPGEIMDDLFSWRRYLLNKPVERYIRLHRDSAIKLIIEIYEIINNDHETVPNGKSRIYEQYIKYKERESSKFGGRKSGVQQYALPYLFFDNTTKGLNINLPSIAIGNEYIKNLNWIIKGDTFEISVKTKVHYSDNGKYSKETLVSVPCDREYYIKVYDDINENSPLKEWEVPIEGLSKEFIIFDNRGKRLSGEYLPKDSGYILYKEDTVKAIYSQMMKDDLYLPEISKGIKASMFFIINKESSLEILTSQNKFRIAPRPSIDFKIISDAYLFDEHGSGGTLDIFVKFPKLEIQSDENKFKDELLIILKNRVNGYKQTFHLSQFINNEEGTVIIDFEKENENIAMPYGIYEVSFYRLKSFLRSFNFAYAPNILHNSKNTNLWPDSNSNVDATGFCYRPQKNVEVIFHSVVKESNIYIANESWKQVNIKENSRFIYGDLIIDSSGKSVIIPFKKTVRNVIWKFWNEKTEKERICFGTELFDDVDFVNQKWWLTIEVNPESLYSMPMIELNSKESHLSEIKFNSSGKVNIPMSIFDTTLENTTFPISILMNYSTRENENKSIELAKIFEKVLLKDIRYLCDDTTKNVPYLLWRVTGEGISGSDNILELVQINNSRFKEILDFKQAKVNTKGTWESLKLSKTLDPGFYKVQRQPVEDFFGDSNRYKPVEIGSGNTILIKPNDIVSGSFTISRLVDITLCLSGNLEMLNKVKRLLIHRIQIIDQPIDREDFRKLICLAYNFAENKNEDKEQETADIIREILNLLSENYLTSEQRLNILIELLESDIFQEKLDVCYQLFNLSLAKFDQTKPTREWIDRLSNIDNMAGIVWVLQSKSYHSYPGFSNRILSTIGFDAALELIRFNRECHECFQQPDWISCYEKIINNDFICSYCSSVLPIKILGNTRDLTNIIDWGRPGRNDEPKVLIEKKSEQGVEFCGRRYVDLLISWYYHHNQNMEILRPHISSMKNQFEIIENVVNSLNTEIRDIVKLMASALQGREAEGSVYEIFYYSGICAIIEALNNRNMISQDKVLLIDKYLITMKKVCPEIVARDLLLAELYMFFNERGAKECQ